MEKNEWVVARVPVSLKAQLLRLAKRHGLSLSETVRLCLATALAGDEDEEAEDDSDTAQ